PKLQNFLGVSYASSPDKAVNWLPRKTFLPMLTGGQQPIFQDDDMTLRSLMDNSFDPAHTVYLPPDVRPFVSVSNRAEAKVVSKGFSAQRIEARVEASAPAMMVVAQSFYHPWHAYVDDRPVPLWRANYAFQAFEVPKGQHQIRLVYEDTAFH